MRRLMACPAVVLAALCALSAMAAPAWAAPDDSSAYSWDLVPGAVPPLDTNLRDEFGQPVTLAAFFGAAPVILDLGYFHCPALCGVVRADLLNAISGSGLIAGRDYQLVSLSIDPAETPADALRAKEGDVTLSGIAGGAGWHYLTGTQAAITSITGAVGFHNSYESRYRQFLHPAGLAILTGSGEVSSYLLGVGYRSGDLRAAVLRAEHGGIARASLPILLLCFHFDATTGRYTLAIEKLLRLLGLLTVVTIAGLIVVLHRRGPRPAA